MGSLLRRPFRHGGGGLGAARLYLYKVWRGAGGEREVPPRKVCQVKERAKRNFLHIAQKSFAKL